MPTIPMILQSYHERHLPMNARIRLAAASDAEALLAIYAPIVAETVISFELEAPTPEEMQRRITTTLPSYPWLVYAEDRAVLGYVYASKHRERAAYQWSADVSVYVHPRARRGGVGRALYISLFALLRLQGIYNAYAGITLPNAASVALHESLGYTPVGVFHAVGFKFGKWHDVGFWERPLGPLVDAPPETLPVGS